MPTPAYLVLDKEAVQYEMTLAGQTLAADLLAPFLRLAFISPLYLTGNRSSIAFTPPSKNKQRLSWHSGRWSSSCGNVLSPGCITGLVHAGLQCVYVCVMKCSHLLRDSRSNGISITHIPVQVGRDTVRWLPDELFPSCYHNDVTVIDAKCAVVETRSGR